jgi:TRAP-type mannitol/chloroaromatic compound transport system permease large subunit
MRQKTDSRIDEILLTIGEFLFLGIVLSKSGISLDYRVER